MSVIVEVKKLKKKDSKLKEMFEWCSSNCSKEYGKDGKWGTSWWTTDNNTKFHFIDERDAFMFQMRFS